MDVANILNARNRRQKMLRDLRTTGIGSSAFNQSMQRVLSKLRWPGILSTSQLQRGCRSQGKPGRMGALL